MTTNNPKLTLPVLAILRGIHPDEVLPIAEVLIAHGITKIEVPLNSPDAFASISLLKRTLKGTAFVGAGTVLTCDEVAHLSMIGCELVVSPNYCSDVVKATKAAGMVSCPGVFTPSEAFAALKAGADILKYFPADLCGPAAIRAWRAVLPENVEIVATGGTNAGNLGEWLNSGTQMIGVGSWLYRPGDTPAQVGAKATALANAYLKYRTQRV
ncbi:2-dehydro-3-deoxy-6-phosphogalactonate aldolase [Phaeobacter sp. C3_T13_0]|uniref:2-dehydro-3-deoxy-6-phosphogalactonate aldolase n=1 Tax=Phaeobacter cretensis TaxID=3342641 RepID=UPI0039BC993A